MKLLETYENLVKISAKFARPVLVTAIWLGTLVFTGGLRLPEWNQSQLNNAIGLQALQSAVKTLGLNPKPIYLLTGAIVVYVAVFELTTRVLWELTPWRFSHIPSMFWYANKSWKEPSSVARRSTVPAAELNLDSIATQLDLYAIKFGKQYEDRYHMAVDWVNNKRARWISFYAGMSAVIICTFILLVAIAIWHPKQFGAGGTVIALLILILIAIVVRIRCESLVEKEFRQRVSFVLNCFLQEEPNTTQTKHRTREVEERIYAELSASPVPGFPYGKVWLLHWLRQLPGFGGIGSYPWRPLASFKADHREVVEGYRENHYGQDPRIMMLPKNGFQRLITRLLHRAVDRGGISPGGAIVGGDVDFDELRQKIREQLEDQRYRSA